MQRDHKLSSGSEAHRLPVAQQGGEVLIFERRALFRECLERCIAAEANCPVRSYGSVHEWLGLAERGSPSLILWSAGGWERDSDHESGISDLAQFADRVPVVIMSDGDEMNRVLHALDRGMRGYIATSISLQVAIEAIRLVRAGGTFIPASSLMAARRHPDPEAKLPGPRLFTFRQTQVIDALRKGKANKIIAYELNMRESTVKVHVRNIMKKLKAKNRTEAAYLASLILEQDR